MVPAELIGKLQDFAGPLGPFESIEERARRRDSWIATLSTDALEVLLEMMMNPPSLEEIWPVTWEDVEAEAIEVMIRIADRAPQLFLKRIGPLSDELRIRPAIIEVIGGLGRSEGLDWLKAILTTKLSEEELIRTASALGEIGGVEARIVLEQMRKTVPARMVNVHREITIAFNAKGRCSGET